MAQHELTALAVICLQCNHLVYRPYLLIKAIDIQSDYFVQILFD